MRPHVSSDAAGGLDSMEIVLADLESDDGWPEAFARCRYVLHALPFPSEPPK